MLGSDGSNYQFLLKGHEDLRQDERVMQLFGLINVCLDNDRATGSKGLGIVRYSVMPLSNNSGVIGWVENCDTLNQLVKQYRESKDMRLGIEVKLLQTKSLNHDKLPLLNKVEIFRQVLEETTGTALYPAPTAATAATTLAQNNTHTYAPIPTPASTATHAPTSAPRIALFIDLHYSSFKSQFKISNYLLSSNVIFLKVKIWRKCFG